MKKGRRRSVFRIDSVWISVVTQRERQFLVTNSRRESAVWNVYDEGSEDWRVFLGVPFGNGNVGSDIDRSSIRSCAASLSTS